MDIHDKIGHQLTKGDVNALRKGKDIVFFLKPDGQSEIKAIMKDEIEHVIKCYTKVSGFRYGLGEIRGADYVLSAALYEATWETIARLIRVGDILKLHWRANNNDNYITNAKLYKDELYMEVRRLSKGTNPTPSTVMTFLIATTICENNAAKMIRHTSTPKSICEVV
ncbi:hypothetical protein SECTIM467_169 [Brevibacillus phage SecTim467]|uniref:Uncharacterized protein n=2 Tax=Jenstvirus jenst TaxID=1982225 RepID=A0A0K2CNU0_9CAUD|nr:hypothetical protein AVV11_gp027 [Brevibacillus phage Jenst]ALA07293.1 hypothetical protein JENST_164 [Brevibacillus phage Jenst]ALA07492.1 hypothetical protein SECTIM467_169 [Brevibacillus phage SecTim467]